MSSQWSAISGVGDGVLDIPQTALPTTAVGEGLAPPACHCEGACTRGNLSVSILYTVASGGYLFSLVREKIGKEGQSRVSFHKADPLDNPPDPCNSSNQYSL